MHPAPRRQSPHSPGQCKRHADAGQRDRAIQCRGLESRPRPIVRRFRKDLDTRTILRNQHMVYQRMDLPVRQELGSAIVPFRRRRQNLKDHHPIYESVYPVVMFSHSRPLLGRSSAPSPPALPRPNEEGSAAPARSSEREGERAGRTPPTSIFSPVETDLPGV
jgi:hypothetical protein